MRRFLMAILFAVVLVCIPAVSAPQTQATAPKAHPADRSDVKVWVNTKSGVYHCPGTRVYGKTKQGAYMTQKEAQAKGYHPASGKVCQ